jgi:hypothetical protein
MKTAFNVQAVKKMLDSNEVIALVERAGKEYIRIWSADGTFQEKLVKSLAEAKEFIEALKSGVKTEDGSVTTGEASDGTTTTSS